MPPNNLEAEQAVLGAILIDGVAYNLLSGTLTPTDFFSSRNGKIFGAMEAVARRGQPIDWLTVVSELEKRGQLDEVESGYLTSLVSDTPTSSHVQSYAEIVRHHAERRALLLLAGEIAGGAYDVTTDIDALRARWVQQFVESVRVRGGAQPVTKYLNEVVDEVTKAKDNPQDVYGMTMGFEDLDHITKGAQPNELVVVYGDSNLGKSMFVAQVGTAAAANGYAGAMYAMEMKGIAMARRMLSGGLSIPTNRLRGGLISEEEYDRLVTMAGEMAQLPIFLSDETHWNTMTLRADLTRLVYKEGVKWAIVDHIGLLTDEDKDPNQRDMRISRALRRIAKDLGICIIAVDTTNKVGQQSGSNQKRFDADVVLQLEPHTPQPKDPVQEKHPNMRTVFVRKMRDGQSGGYFHLVMLKVSETRNGRMMTQNIPLFGNASREALP